MKLHVVFGKNKLFTPVADADALAFAQAQVDRIAGTEQELQVNVSNYIVILAFRLLVKRGVISRNEIVFYEGIETDFELIDKSTFDKSYIVDQNGTFNIEPSFNDIQMDMLMEFIV